MYGNRLMTELRTGTNREISTDSSELFIDFLNRLEGWKTKCKNLHWAAYRKNIHEYLDDFLDILSNYQDGLAEGYMGILGKMKPNVIKGVSCNSINPIDFIEEVKDGTLEFYSSIPQDTEYKGITSECETFIQNINKYRYLFSICDIR